MKFERARERESLDASIAHIARAYGFTSSPVPISKKAVADQGDMDVGIAVVTALVKAQQPTKRPQHVWAAAKKSGGMVLSFTVMASRHAISHALVVKTALSIAEVAGYTDLVVGVSSIGDAESRRRFQRELNSFFRKHAELIEPDMLKRAQQNPESVYRNILAQGGELAERLPRPIDYLSESSRKSMVDTLHLFESVGIQYELQPHLPATLGVHGEMLFAISGVDQKGERATIATGGRLDELMKKQDKQPVGHSVGLSLMMPDTVEPTLSEAQLACFVVHVGEAAKLRAFSLIEILWRANVSVEEALLAESLRDQMDEAKRTSAKYIAIVGQREALDNTVILRNVGTGMQQSLPVERLASHVGRVTR